MLHGIIQQAKTDISVKIIWM